MRSVRWRSRLWVLLIPWPLVVLPGLFLGAVGLGKAVGVMAAVDGAGQSLRGVTVAIDPGHGGPDGGVQHPGEGLLESAINLDMALRLEKAILARGGKAVLTRREDVEYFPEARKDLGYRLGLAGWGGADLFISIHTNKFPDASQFGAQTFHDPKSEEGRRLALLIQEELVRLHPENYREALAADLFVLRENRVPAVLVEIGFISNPDDRARLRAPAWRDKLAAAIARGVERFTAGEGKPRGGKPRGR